MGVPTSEVGYTPALPRREDQEVHKDMWGALGERKKKCFLWTWYALFPAVILSLISSSIELSVFTVVPKYLNEFACSNSSSCIYVGRMDCFVVQYRYLVLLLTINPAFST